MTSTEELERLLAEATPGPWRVINYDCGDTSWYDHNGPCPSISAPDDQDCSIVHWDGFKQEHWSSANGNQKQISANAALIVAAVNALPELLERVKRLEEALKFYADPNRWPNMPNPKNPHYDLEMDAGSRARFALHVRAALNQEPGQ